MLRLAKFAFLIALFFPSELLADPPKSFDLPTAKADLAALEREDDALQRQLQAIISISQMHLTAGRAGLDQVDSKAVANYNETSKRLRDELGKLNSSLKICREKEWIAGQRLRIAELQARNAALDKDIAAIEKYIKQVRVQLNRLMDESLKDARQLESAALAAAEDRNKMVVELTGQTIDQFLAAVGEIGGLTDRLKKIDLKSFSGEEWAEFREGVTELRQSAEFFNSPEGKLAIKRIADGQVAVKLAIQATNDPKSADQQEKLASLLSKLLLSTVAECESKTRSGAKLEAILKKIPPEKIEKAGGMPARERLVLAGKTLAYGELAINLFHMSANEAIDNLEVIRINDQVDRRNALIKSFSPGGIRHQAYSVDVARLRAALDEKNRNNSEIKEIAARLANIGG